MWKMFSLLTQVIFVLCVLLSFGDSNGTLSQERFKLNGKPPPSFWTHYLKKHFPRSKKKYTSTIPVGAKPSLNLEFRLSRHTIFDETYMKSICGENRYSRLCFPCCKIVRSVGVKPGCDCSVFKAKRDCLDHYNSGNTVSGLHRVPVNNGDNERIIDVYCEQETNGGGWTVMQRRLNGDINFYQDWQNYKNGFGDLNYEFWMGNENIYYLTKGDQQNELRIELEDWTGKMLYAHYSDFNISNEDSAYRLYVYGYHGNAGDGLRYHNGQPFSTFDVDNDDFEESCAQACKGAWWYERCLTSNLNGKIYNEPSTKHYGSGVHWLPFKPANYSLKSVAMMVRRKNDYH